MGERVETEPTPSTSRETTIDRTSLLDIWRSDLGIDELSNDPFSDAMSDMSEFTRGNYIHSLPTRQLRNSKNCRKCPICLKSYEARIISKYCHANTSSIQNALINLIDRKKS